MTAEVAVINALGIALASDSAVTVSHDEGEKIYTSSDKLFQLSKNAQVAIMISGGATMGHTHWEVAIKMYRKQLANQTFLRVSDYAHDFFNFLCANQKMFPQSMQEEYGIVLASVVLLNVVNECGLKIASKELRHELECNERQSLSKKEKTNILHETIVETTKKLNNQEKILGITPAVVRDFLADNEKLFTEKKEKILKDFSLPEKTWLAIEDLIVASIASVSCRSNAATKFVFAGFGEDEYFPVCLSYVVDGMIRNNLRFIEKNEESDQIPRAAIFPFGQVDVMNAFLMGVSTEFETAFAEELAPLSEKVKKVKMDFAAPIARMVGSLPKFEMAYMAEMLVNLTGFRFRVSPVSETVGGPIDVALITKGDGFVWIKKKQYYPPELNPHKTGGSIGN